MKSSEKLCLVYMTTGSIEEAKNIGQILAEQNLSDIQNWCYERLSREKVPVKWFIEEEIPKTDRGKLNRDRVAEHCLDDSKED